MKVEIITTISTTELQRKINDFLSKDIPGVGKPILIDIKLSSTWHTDQSFHNALIIYND